MMDPITGWFEVIHYKDKQAMTISNLVETMWLTRYTWLTEITYDRES